MTTETTPTVSTRGRIVVGIDGSGPSRMALRTAFLEAARRNADLDVVSTYAEDPIWTGRAPVAVADQGSLRSEAAARTRTAVDEVRSELLVEDLAALGNVEVRRIIDTGDPAPVLVGRAEGAELLVVGNRGRGAVASALLGSVALHCVTRAPCPVLVVHGDLEVHPPASAVVIVGLDGSDAAMAALREGAAEAQRLGCRLEVLAAYSQEFYWTDVYAGDPPVMDRIRAAVRAHAEEAVRTVEAELAARPGGTAPPMSVELVEGPAAEALLERSADALMLVVGSRGHGPIRGLVLGSVALHCAIHARCPVLVVHPHLEAAREEAVLRPLPMTVVET